jgi:uncharacterized damage-inducible protein DinB
MMLVTPNWDRLMARHSGWQDAGLVELVSTLPTEQVARDRGAFWGGILRTMSHLLWRDLIELSRFAGSPKPEPPLDNGGRMGSNAESYASALADADRDLIGWADRSTAKDLEGWCTWDSPAAGRRASKPKAVKVTQLLNHQSHYRDQHYAMLTSLRLRPRTTDLASIPDRLSREPCRRTPHTS